jgi:hypothetical protein
MSELDKLVLDSNPDDWLSALPVYQQRGIEALLSGRAPEQAAMMWLTQAGPADTAPFGGLRTGASLLYKNVLVEIRKLLCGDNEYLEERKDVQAAIGTSKVALIATLAAAIGPHLGAAAVFIAPVVAIVLSVVAKAGAVTVCQALEALVEEEPVD